MHPNFDFKFFMFTCVLLLVPTCMACTTLTNHSGTPTIQRAHHSTFQGTLLKAFFQIGKCHIQFPLFCKILLLKLAKNKIASVVPRPGRQLLCWKFEPKNVVIFVWDFDIFRRLSWPFLHSTIECCPLLQKFCKNLFWCKTVRKEIE